MSFADQIDEDVTPDFVRAVTPEETERQLQETCRRIGACLMKFDGCVDPQTAAREKRGIVKKKYGRAKRPHLFVDLSKATSIDCVGFYALCALRTLFAERGGQCIVFGVNGNNRIRSEFDHLNRNKPFHVVDDIHDAIALFQQPTPSVPPSAPGQETA